MEEINSPCKAPEETDREHRITSKEDEFTFRDYPVKLKAGINRANYINSQI